MKSTASSINWSNDTQRAVRGNTTVAPSHVQGTHQHRIKSGTDASAARAMQVYNEQLSVERRIIVAWGCSMRLTLQFLIRENLQRLFTLSEPC
ncbi:MAG: hypothetical protein AAF394_14190 [Planctomycetota bacterium]